MLPPIQTAHAIYVCDHVGIAIVETLIVQRVLAGVVRRGNQAIQLKLSKISRRDGLWKP